MNELSQKLLEGCKLLSDSCPETNVPLVLTADGRMYSVGNGCYYSRDGGELSKVPAGTPMPASPSKGTVSPKSTGAFVTAATSAPPGTVMSASAAALTPTVASASTPLPVQGEGSSLSSQVAAKLLEGYTLLSESCPVTSVPLVQDTAGHILSVGTGRWYERTGGQLIETAPPAAVAAAGTPAAPPPPPVYSTEVVPPTGRTVSFGGAGTHGYPLNNGPTATRLSASQLLSANPSSAYASPAPKAWPAAASTPASMPAC